MATLALAPWYGKEAVARAVGARRASFYMFMAGLTAACAVMSLYFAITRPGSSVLVISPIVSCNPLFTLLLARLFLRQSERVTRELVAGTLLAVGGVGMVVVGGVIY